MYNKILLLAKVTIQHENMKPQSNQKLRNPEYAIAPRCVVQNVKIELKSKSKIKRR